MSRGGWRATAIDPTLLAAGSYTIVVRGNAFCPTSLGSSMYFSAPVPEPATWDMMLLGMIGASVRGRRRSTKVSFA